MEETQSEPTHPAPGLDILLVEDEAAHVELVRRAFEAEDDTHLRVAPDLAQAELEIARSRPDVLVLDSTLPDGLGLDFFRRLPSTEPGNRKLPTLLLTSHDDARLAREADEAGVFRYLEKRPEHLFDLPDRIRDLLSAWRIDVETRATDGLE